MAKLTAVYGPMFAGKTTWIIKKISELEGRGEKCLVFKPRLDNRYGKESKLHSHSGSSGQAILVDEQKPNQMLYLWDVTSEHHQTIIIDEVMFFSNEIIEVVKEMLAAELDVIVAGLDTNFKKEPFGVMSELIGLAHEHIGLGAKCYKCGGVAQYSARIKGGTDDIVVGAADSYQPACALCHTICDDISTTSIFYPDLRPVAKRSFNYRIEIAADSMRVGKTTAVKVIAEGLRLLGKTVTESYEDWQNNPYLKKSYSDPDKNFLVSQKWFIKRKWEQIKNAGEGIFIQDVAPETDFCYAATNLQIGRMSRKHFDSYVRYYRLINWNMAPLPDLLVYLCVSDEELLRRAEASKREFETVESDYFLMMKRVNREWLEKIGKKRNILLVDTDKCNFASDMAAKQELVMNVKNRLELLRKI